MRKITSKFEVFYLNDKNQYHSDVGPARIFNYGGFSYWKNGNIHRLDGPAFYFDNSYYEFWIDDVFYFSKEFAKKTDHLLCDLCKKFCKQKCF